MGAVTQAPPRLPAPLLAWALVLAAPAFAAGPPSGKPSLEAIGEEVASRIEALRRTEGASRLERRPALDAAARDRAAAIASMPQGRRLAVREPIETVLRAHGIRNVRSAETRVAILAGYPDLAGEVVAQWRDARDSRLLDARWSALGIGAAAGDGDEAIVVALFVEDARIPVDLRELEERTEAAVNAERERRGLPALRPSEALRGVARSHSEDMATRGYFDHVSPDGDRPEDRVVGGGLRFRRVSENIAMSAGADDPVATAVEGWLRSPGHRANLLDPEVLESGVGVAVGDGGRIYFTQLFYAPPE